MKKLSDLGVVSGGGVGVFDVINMASQGSGVLHPIGQVFGEVEWLAVPTHSG